MSASSSSGTAARSDLVTATPQRAVMLALIVSILAVVLIRTAWVCDDSYITFRTVDNFVHGYGMRWNIDERVQSFTHPLWMFLMSAAYGLTGEPYFTSIALSIALTLLTVVLLGWRVASAPGRMTVAALTLLYSRAFVDYSTSGLENALSHLLIVTFLIGYWGHRRGAARTGVLALCAALLMLNRLDLGVLVVPALIGAAMDDRWRSAPAAVAGLLPLVAWEAFSLVYYGFPFPNTAYAKLGTGLTAADMLPHGIAYLGESLRVDPVTLIAIVAGVVAGFHDRTRREWTLAVGVLAYLAYVVRIGGDFMSGRMLTAPLMVAVGLAAHSRWPRIAPARIAVAAGAATVLALTWVLPAAPILSGREFGDVARHIPASGITDERAYYYRFTGLLLTTRLRQGPQTDEPARVLKYRREGQSVVLRDAVGFFGFYAGPSMHVVDVFGLGDPLLARLPTGPGWRIGHYYRQVPAGYVETLRNGANQIGDPSIAREYATLAIITRDPLWSWERWRAIWRANVSRGSMNERRILPAS